MKSILMPIRSKDQSRHIFQEKQKILIETIISRSRENGNTLNKKKNKVECKERYQNGVEQKQRSHLAPALVGHETIKPFRLDAFSLPILGHTSSIINNNNKQ